MKPYAPNILHEIVDHKLQEISLRKRRCALSRLQDQIAETTDIRPFASAINSTIVQGKAAVIAELKKAAPTRGLLRRNYQPAEIARSYENAGAACISVATDSRYSEGDDEHLSAVRASCSIPVLRND